MRQRHANAQAYQLARQQSGRQLIATRRYRGLPEPTRPCPARCELCGRPPKNHALCLDHDHETGHFRGWLCISCNRALGVFGDNVVGLQHAIAYLEKGPRT